MNELGGKGKKRKKDRAVFLSGPTKEYICIVCPNCCSLQTDGIQVIGARCEKGEAFARSEWVEPMRVLTTTVRCETKNGVYFLPVKTSCPVPLSRLSPMVKRIKALRLSEILPIGSRITLPDSTEILEIIVTGE